MVGAAIIATLRFVSHSYSGNFAGLSDADCNELAGVRIYQNLYVLEDNQVADHPVDSSDSIEYFFCSRK